MDQLVIFLGLLVATFALNLLAAGRDQILFQERPRLLRRSLVVGFSVVAVVFLVRLGMSLSWALALVVPGPVGAFLGDWLGHGGWIVLRHRLAEWGWLPRGD